MKNTMRKILSSLLVVLCVTMTPLTGISRLAFGFIAQAASTITSYKTGDILEFGWYPQSQVTDTATISALNAASGEWVSYDYYSGTGVENDGKMTASDYMRYKDVLYGGNKYRGVVFDSYRPYYTGYTSSSTWQEDNGYNANTVYWFKYEPVRWRVLDPATGMVLSENILDSQAYNNYVLKSESYWGNSEKTHYANNYEKSSVRQWLNSDFYNTAFSAAQQNILASTTLDNSAYGASSSAYNSASTNDKIYLLSYNDVFNSNYGFSKAARVAQGSAYAKCQGLVVKSGNSYWLLRTAGGYSEDCCKVYHNGEVSHLFGLTYRTDFGVRPAFNFNLNSAIFQSTVEDIGNSSGNDGNVPTGPIFPAGYDFDRDSYKFENINETIAVEYYTGMFGTEKGTEIYNYIEDGETHGHCYGMALTTAATLLNAPAVTDYLSWTALPYTKLRSINQGTMNIDLDMSAKDYIKYGYIYQFSVNAIVEKRANLNNTESLIAAVENYVDGGAPVIIGLLEGDVDAGPGGHAVFAIGMDGNDILVNDSNEPKNIKRIAIKGNSWSYSGGGWTWTSEDSDISFFTDVLTPYMNITWAVDIVGGNVPSNEEEEISGTGDRYAIGMPVDGVGVNLVADAEQAFNFSQSDSMLSIENNMEAEHVETEARGSLYWLVDGHTINAQNISDKNAVVKVTGDELAISANIPTNAQTEISVDAENENTIAVRCNENETGIITFSTVTADGGFVDTVISGTASCDTITATQTETGLVVTGISDGTVTLSKDDEVIATQTISDAISDIEITYDKTGADESIEVDYEQPEEPTEPEVPTEPEMPTEPDVPAEPDEPTDDSSDCSCLCHSKNSFMQFIYTILRFLWQLFGMNMDCACGAKHFDAYFFG
ncbi:MAG: hypothetical protein IJA31_12225 [Clostridia bacterium]|nr:hypothetical protein [Clostridia bacterium]